MFSFKRKSQPVVDDVVDVIRIENAEDRLDRALQESCEDTEFSAQLTKAVKSIQQDRIMLAHSQGMNGDVCSYAEAMQGLLGLVRQSGDHDVEMLKKLLQNAVSQILDEGRQFETKEDAEAALRRIGNR